MHLIVVTQRWGNPESVYCTHWMLISPKPGRGNDDVDGLLICERRLLWTYGAENASTKESGGGEAASTGARGHDEEG
ncbi:hypothetical protein BC936DRAFT_145974 [Jimgerdemannia flammicorona]|uniref:Uncharacterized protein n=2 Tax=Jimgerdemannia flammicorona TaxID=994334 RepID=A0A433D8P6_9FUNG|nr:hypothetical protein BC936DRAFT_145974 [Jimgerdemannia flammicorona]RUS33383.1 hypothetical protein BC938DRAFT_471961 [Jimgerdemannia flammicorona]